MKKIPEEWSMACAGLCIGLVFMWFLVPVVSSGWINLIPFGMAMLCYCSVVISRRKDVLPPGAFVKVFDAEVGVKVSGIVLASRSRDRKSYVCLVATASNIAWQTIGVGDLIQPTDPSNFLVPNPTTVQEKDLPSWSVIKHPSQNTWNFIGWDEFIRKSSHA